MNIEIKDTSASENFEKHYHIQWELSMRKMKKQRLVRIIIYGSLVLMGILGAMFSDNDSNALIQIHMDTIAICLGLTMLYVIFFNWRAVKKFSLENLKYIESISKQLLKGDNTLTFQLTEESIKLEQYQSSEHLGWSYFSHYSVHENLIILHKNTKVIENFVIRKELVTPPEYDEILYFCNERLKRHYYS